MNDYSFHLNITQDIGHGLTLMFICAIAILAAVLIEGKSVLENYRVATEQEIGEWKEFQKKQEEELL